MGHLAGFIDGYNGFDSHVQSVNGSRLLVTSDGISAKLSGDHLDSKLYPYDLLNPVLAPSIRKLPSVLDVQLLNAIRTQAKEQGSREAGENTALNAPLTSAPLVAILNGTFDSIDTPRHKCRRILASSVLPRYLNASTQIPPFGYVHKHTRTARPL